MGVLAEWPPPPLPGSATAFHGILISIQTSHHCCRGQQSSDPSLTCIEHHRHRLYIMAPLVTVFVGHYPLFYQVSLFRSHIAPHYVIVHSENTFVTYEPNVMYIYNKMLFVISLVSNSYNFTLKSYIM